MSSPAFQNSAQQLNAKMEGSARLVLDEVDKKLLRTIAHSSSKCVVACFDKAGSTGSSEELEVCSRKCQIPYQQATNVVQNVRHAIMDDDGSCLLFAARYSRNAVHYVHYVYSVQNWY